MLRLDLLHFAIVLCHVSQTIAKEDDIVLLNIDHVLATDSCVLFSLRMCDVFLKKYSGDIVVILSAFWFVRPPSNNQTSFQRS